MSLKDKSLPSWIDYYAESYLFKKISLENSTILDIGSGDGLFSYYAHINGAKKVIGLEPEIDGCTLGSFETAKIIEYSKKNHGLLKFFPICIDNYLDNYTDTFDIVLMHNSINHIDEKSCMNLHRDEYAQSTYIKLFTRIKKIIHPGGMLIISDCARRNFFPDFGLRHSFAPSIEWHKHQSPRLWAKLLKKSGFMIKSIDWSTPIEFSKIGRFFLANRFCAYFYTSHFCLHAFR